MTVTAAKKACTGCGRYAHTVGTARTCQTCKAAR